MSKLYKVGIFGLLLLAVVTLSTQVSQAHGFGKGEFRGHGEFSLLTPELKDSFREDCANLTDEERQAKREERQAMREEHRAEWEAFVGLDRDELKAELKSGKSIGDVLLEQGKTEAEAETFLTERADDKVDMIVERHDLDTEQEQTLRDRIVEFVQNILDKWFN